MTLRNSLPLHHSNSPFHAVPITLAIWASKEESSEEARGDISIREGSKVASKNLG